MRKYYVCKKDNIKFIINGNSIIIIKTSTPFTLFDKNYIKFDRIFLNSGNLTYELRP